MTIGSFLICFLYPYIPLTFIRSFCWWWWFFNTSLLSNTIRCFMIIFYFPCLTLQSAFSSKKSWSSLLENGVQKPISRYWHGHCSRVSLLLVTLSLGHFLMFTKSCVCHICICICVYLYNCHCIYPSVCWISKISVHTDFFDSNSLAQGLF